MALELKFNEEHMTLDLIGRLPAVAKRKVTQLMTYNPTLSCYQGPVNEQVLQLAKDLNAIISEDVIEDVWLYEDYDGEGEEIEETPTVSPESEKREETEAINYIGQSSISCVNLNWV